MKVATFLNASSSLALPPRVPPAWSLGSRAARPGWSVSLVDPSLNTNTTSPRPHGSVANIHLRRTENREINSLRKNLSTNYSLARDELSEEKLNNCPLTEINAWRKQLEQLRDSRRYSLLYSGTSTAPENSRPRANQESTRRYSRRC